MHYFEMKKSLIFYFIFLPSWEETPLSAPSSSAPSAPLLSRLRRSTRAVERGCKQPKFF